MNPIIKKGVRILRPKEYTDLRSYLKPPKLWQLDGLLLTGMRYIEAQRFQENPNWLDHKFINLPKGASLKVKAKFSERSVRLSDFGIENVPNLLKPEAKLPTRQGWDWLMRTWSKEAGLDSVGMSAKTTRKTWESWLAFCIPDHLVMIAQNQGHTGKTQMEHYLNMPFYAAEQEEMKPYIAGWV